MYQKRSLAMTFSVLLMAAAGCASKETPTAGMPGAGEDKLKQYHSDFIVQPAIAKLLTNSSDYWNGSSKKVSVSEAALSVSGGEPPYRAEVIEGKNRGAIDAQSLRFKSGSNSGFAVVRITDSKNRVGHAVMEIVAPPTLKLKESQELRPCEQVALKTEGGFEPYRYEIPSGSASISQDQSALVASASPESFQVKVTDAEGNSDWVDLKSSYRYSGLSANFCFGSNGKLLFPETANAIPYKDRKYLSFVPSVATFAKDSEVITAGTEFPGNDLVGFGTYIDSYSSYSFKNFREKYALKISVRRYDASGKSVTTFGTHGAFIYEGAADEITKAEAVQSLPDGKILVAGISLREDGVRVVMIRLTEQGQLDSGFGVGGVVYSESYGRLPAKLVSGLFGVGYQARPAQVKKVIVQGAQDGGRILLHVNYLRPGKHTAFDSRSEVVAYDSLGKIDPQFGVDGRITSSEGDPSIGIPKEFEDVTLSPAGQVMTLEGDAFGGVIAKINAYTKDGKVDNTFGKRGDVIVKDPLWGKRTRNMVESNEQVYHYVNQSDLFDNLRVSGLIAGPGGSITITGISELREEVGGKSSRKVAIGNLQKEKDGKYTAKWQFGRNQDSFIGSADTVVAGAIHQGTNSGDGSNWQRILVGAKLYSPSSSGAAFQVTRSGVSLSPYGMSSYLSHWDASHDLVGGSENEWLLQLGLSEGSPDSNGRARDRVLIVTDGGLYQYLLMR